MVLAQSYNFLRYGFEDYAYVMKAMQENARTLAEKLTENGNFALIGGGADRSPRDDIAQACITLEKKGGAHPAERNKVKTGTGY